MLIALSIASFVAPGRGFCNIPEHSASRVFGFCSPRRCQLCYHRSQEKIVWNFIDDSGAFSWGSNKGRSLFCGVTISDAELPELEKRFLAWKRTIVGHSLQELKGKDLRSNQLFSFVHKVLPLTNHNIVVTVVGGDTSVTAESYVEKMRDQSAEIFRLSSELCAKYRSETNKNDRTIEFYRQMSGWVGKRSAPNALWIVVLIQAILDTLQHGIVRFAEPEYSSEFESIEFKIDRSFIHRDEHLRFWKEWLRADLMKSSRSGTLFGIKEWPPEHPYNRRYRVYKNLTDHRDLFQSHMSFEDSKSMIGLQVADICANICYRYYRNDSSDTRAYDTLRPRIMGRDGIEIHLITVDERSLHQGDLSDLVTVFDMERYKHLADEREEVVNALDARVAT